MTKTVIDRLVEEMRQRFNFPDLEVTIDNTGKLGVMTETSHNNDHVGVHTHPGVYHIKPNEVVISHDAEEYYNNEDALKGYLAAGISDFIGWHRGYTQTIVTGGDLAKREFPELEDFADTLKNAVFEVARDQITIEHGYAKQLYVRDQKEFESDMKFYSRAGYDYFKALGIPDTRRSESEASTVVSWSARSAPFNATGYTEYASKIDEMKTGLLRSFSIKEEVVNKYYDFNRAFSMKNPPSIIGVKNSILDILKTYAIII